MSKRSPEEIRKILQTLQICADDPRMAMQQCEKLLAALPENDAVRKYKVCTLVRAAEFDKAIAFIKSKPLTDVSQFQLAYCMYRKEQYAGALKHLTNLKDEVHVEVLKAQILYRMGDFSAAATCYANTLPKIGQGSSNFLLHDVLANYFAALNEAGDREGAQKASLAYQEHIGDADILLNMTLTSDASYAAEHLEMILNVRPKDSIITEGNVSEDDAGLCALLSALYIISGGHEEAQDYLSALSTVQTLPPVLQAVRANNSLCAQESTNFFDSLCMIKQCQSTAIDSKLNKLQRMIVKYNNTVLLMQIGKLSSAMNLSKALVKEFPNERCPALAALYAVAKCMKKKSNEAIEQLANANAFDKIDGFARTLRLFQTQARLDQSDFRDIRKILQVFPDDEKYSIGVVSAVLNLATENDHVRETTWLLEEGLEYWKSRGASNFEKVVELTEMLADFYMAQKMYPEAVKILQEMKAYRQDAPFIRKLVHALTYTDVDQAYTLGIEHDCFVEPMEDFDAEALIEEELPIVREENIEAAFSLPKKSKKKSKKKIVRDAGAPEPDPERWMPMRDRPSLQKVGKKTLARMAEERRQYAQKKREEHAARVMQSQECGSVI